jgi:uncharacterized protein YcnI
MCVIAASAHAVVFPPEAPTGAYQKYTLRVPNERDFPTVRVAIVFPAAVRVISFDEVPGWTLETTAGEAAGSAAAATWTGTIPVGRFVELSFIGVNPAEATTLEWDVVQTYADGMEVSWSGPEGSSTPASLTRVLASAPLASATPPTQPTSGLGTILGGAALLVALVSLGLSLRPTRS